MKTVTLISALASAVIAVLLTFYLSNLKHSDVHYQLSRPIPAEVAGTSGPTIVQQIEIANLGTAVAERLQVKIGKKIEQLTVVKDSAADKFTRFDGAQSTEVDYDALRPTGRVQIVLMGGQAISDGDLVVRDLSGPAKPALAVQTSPWSKLPYFVAIVVVLLYFYLSIRSLAKDSFVTTVRYDLPKALRRRKPFLISEDDWERSLKDGARMLALNEYNLSTDPTTWTAYKVLNAPAPEGMPHDVWDAVAGAISKGLVEKLQTESANAGFYGVVNTVRSFLIAPRPVSLPAESWQQLIRRLGQFYTTVLLQETIKWHRIENLRVGLATTKPEQVDEEAWSRYMDVLRRLYFWTLAKAVSAAADPINFLNGSNLSILSSEDRDNLNWLAYYRQMAKLPDVTTTSGARTFSSMLKPAFMSDEDYVRLSQRAGAVLKASESEKRSIALLHNIGQILGGATLSTERPEVIPLDDWKNLKELELRIVMARRDLELREKVLNQEQSETARLKDTVLGQLKILHAFINDPDVVNRIEQYEGVFAPGNLATLKRLAEMLQDLRHNGKD